MIVKQIAENYHKTHTYYGTQTGEYADIYVCGDMSSDVWDMIKTKGINAQIKIGDIHNDITNITESTHAWVIAEVSPGGWIAVESTGGYLVCKDELHDYCAVINPRYYTGWVFKDPKEFKDYLDKLEHGSVGCKDGFLRGKDNLCHPACGVKTYCTGNSVCINGECRGCSSGYVLGSDYQCHPECGAPGRYCVTGTCYNGQCVTCPSGRYLATDGRCYSY
jgi:hypothetical protein